MAKPRSDARPLRAGTGGSAARRVRKRFLPLSAALPVLLTCPAWAAVWDITPTLTVGEIYTDNLSLAPDALRRSEWITQVTPGLSIAATGARAKFNAQYAPEAVYYARGQNDNEVFQRGNVSGNAELAQQLLFVDAGARVDQYNVSLRGPLATSNVNATGNRSTVSTYYASPYLRRDFGSEVQAEARYTYSVWSSDNTSTLSNSEAGRTNLGLKSGPAYKLLTWGVDYVRETINYDAQQDTLNEAGTAKVRRLITPTVGLLAQAGYEKYEAGAVAPVREGLSWSAGFDWTPTPRTALAATAGERLDGDTYSLDFRHRTRLTTWSVSYKEEVTSARSQFLVPATTSTAGYLDNLFLSQFPDPAARQKAVEDFIARTGLPPSLSAPVNFFSSQLFLVKRWQASAGIEGVRNLLIANVFRETRARLFGNLVLSGTGDFAASNTITQAGTSFLWSLRVTPLTTWNLDSAYSRNEFVDTSRVDKLAYIRMGFTRQFQPRLSGSLSYRRQENDSNQSAFSYTENSALATLLMTF